MFRDFQLHDIEFALGCVSMEKLLYDHTGEILETAIDPDYIMENYFESLEKLGDFTDLRRNDENGEQEWHFGDSSIKTYYRLCHEYGKKHHIRFKTSPYVKEATHHVRKYMNQIQDWSCDWALVFKKNRKRDVGLYFYTGPEFFQPVQAVEAILEVISFFKDGVQCLQNKLNQSEQAAPKMKTLKIGAEKTERKAA